jgi:hypothetical protein
MTTPPNLQTGSGKTYTMMGSSGNEPLNEDGIIPQLAADLFKAVTSAQMSDTVKFLITVSYLEIYNEVIHDLLNPSADEHLKVGAVRQSCSR